jgi:hypothetical protein
MPWTARAGLLKKRPPPPAAPATPVAVKAPGIVEIWSAIARAIRVPWASVIWSSF